MARYHFRGRVLWYNGTGMPDADISIRDADLDNLEVEVFSARTDDHGFFDGDSDEWDDAIEHVHHTVTWVDKQITVGNYTFNIKVPTVVTTVDGVSLRPGTPLTIHVRHRHKTTTMLYIDGVPVLTHLRPDAICIPEDESHPLIRERYIERWQKQHYRWERVDHLPDAPDAHFDPKLAFLHLSGTPVGSLLSLTPGEQPPGDFMQQRTRLANRLTQLNHTLLGLPDFDSEDDYRQMFDHVNNVMQIARPPHDDPRPIALAGHRTEAEYVAARQSTPAYVLDRSFVEQRLVGPNPLMLRQIDALPAHFALSDQQFRTLVDFDSTRPHLATALQNGWLFLADYEILDHDEVKGPRDDAGDSRRLFAPMALFYKPDKPAPDVPTEIVAIAIQLAQSQTSDANPIITHKGDPQDWYRAMLAVQAADSNVHEMKSHLWDIHFALEPIKVAMERCLYVNHPISVLLRSHFLGFLWNNRLGLAFLINRGGPTDRLLNTGLDGSAVILREAHTRWDFTRNGFLQSLEDRRMLDPARSVKTYPYRDDGKLVWDAIYGFVREYLSIYYDTDEDVENDTELADWLNEMRSVDVAGIPGTLTAVGDKDPFRLEMSLTAFVTQIIWTCTAQHAAVNYSQWDFLSFGLNMPFALYGDLRDSQLELLKIVPKKRKAIDQLVTMGQLSLYAYKYLGDYPSLGDPDADAAADNFRARLEEVGGQIGVANGGRPEGLKYQRLLPSRISQNLNV